MNIQFILSWHQGTPLHRAFKSKDAYALFSEYAGRLKPFCRAEAAGRPKSIAAREGKVWLCDRAQGSEVLSSEELAAEIDELKNTGIKNLSIVIGGPDGFSAEELKAWKPDLRWSFGPLTLPHELAAVVAAEQVYRAWTILAGQPYHKGHS